MASCLLALGSNLGDRSGQLRLALGGIAQLPQTRLSARSAWHETAAIGGPAGQGSFLNGAALVDTALSPEGVLDELRRLEERLGRVRSQRWEARTIDLDLLLYDDVVRSDSALEIPHPRMAFRPFVLEPAVEVAPWMVHPDSGWTVARLLDQLHHGGDRVALAAANEQVAAKLIRELSQRLPSSYATPAIVRWTREEAESSSTTRPKLLLAVPPATGSPPRDWRKMLHLPERGPVAWIAGDRPDEAVHDALAAIQSVWPSLAGG